MKLLTMDSDYAIRALIHLAQCPDRFVSTKRISEEQKVPYQYLRQIVKKLIQHKYVLSKEGVQGGIRINKKPKDIKIVDVMEIFQGPLQLSSCLFRNKLCQQRKTCVLRVEIKRIEKILKNEFSNVTIEKLAKGINPKNEKKNHQNK